MISVQPGLRGSNDLRVRRKKGDLSIVFSVQETGGSLTGPDMENRVGDQGTGSPGRPVSSGLPSARWAGTLSCKNKTTLLTFPLLAFFLQNVLQLHQQRWVILRVDSLGLWKIINEEDAVLIPKNWGENFSSGTCIRIFLGGGGEPLCRHSFDCCFVSGS